MRPYFYENTLSHLRYGLDSDSYFTISESLGDCDVLIHYGSTGGIEATVLGIPNLILASSTEGIDKRILKSGHYFSSVDSLIDEILTLVKSPSYSHAVAANQHKNQVMAYGFDLRQSEHTNQLVNFIEMNSLPNEKEILFFARLKLWLNSSFTQFKYKIKKTISPAHMVKATRIDIRSLERGIWDPLRSELRHASIKNRGRAIRLKSAI